MFLWISVSLSSKNRSVSQLDSIGKPVFVRPNRRFFLNILLAGFPAATKPTLTLANLVTTAAMLFGGGDNFMVWMNEFGGRRTKRGRSWMQKQLGRLALQSYAADGEIKHVSVVKGGGEIMLTLLRGWIVWSLLDRRRSAVLLSGGILWVLVVEQRLSCYSLIAVKSDITPKHSRVGKARHCCSLWFFFGGGVRPATKRCI